MTVQRFGRSRIRGGRGLAAGLAAAAALAAVAFVPHAQADAPSLTATAVFGKASYVSGQAVSVRLSVHNSGTSAATGISAGQDYGADELRVDQHGFGVFDRGATIAAGHTVSVTVTGYLADPAASTVTFTGNLFGRDGLGVAAFSATAPVTVRTATLRGRVFGDANANGRADAGEARAHVRVRLSYGYGEKTYSTITDSRGRYHLTVPRGAYYLTGGTKRWVIVPRPVTVRVKDRTLDLRAVRPLGHVLTVSLHFTKHRYAVHHRAHVIITLRNTGSRPLRGIAPSCNRIGDPQEIVNTGRGWGRLAIGRSGVLLPPNTTRTFRVTSRVPRAARRAGVVVVACDFGYPGVETGYRPSASDGARVPGAFGALAAQIGHAVTGQPGTMVGLKNVRVVLLDRTVCPLYVRRATTDADGRFRIGHVPAGPSYQLYLYPPHGWKVGKPNPTPAFVFGEDTVRLFIQARPGTAHVPRVPTTCA